MKSERAHRLLRESIDWSNGIQLASFPDVSLNDLTIKDTQTVYLYWTQAVQAVSVLLEGELFPLNISLEGMAASLERKMFPVQKAGKYPINIMPVDKTDTEHTLIAT
ncbi:hypothetical protein KKA14_17165 [bacterium]|nr:hypothetical protein [bacterium]